MPNHAQRRAIAKETGSSRSKIRQFPQRPGAASLSSLANPSSTVIEQLVTLYTRGHYVEAEQLAREITQQFPKLGFGWKVLGVVLKLQGRTDDALAPMKQAAQLLPDDAEVHNNYGVTLKNLGYFVEAEDCYRRALEINPAYAWAHTNLGNALKEQGRFTDAEASYRLALEIEPDFAEAHTNLGITLHEQGRFTEAVDSYRRAIEIRPDFVEAHNKLGVVFKNLGCLVDAELSYRRALAIKPDCVNALCNLGTILKDLGRWEDGVEVYRHALTIKPDDADVYSNLLFTINFAGTLQPPYLLSQARAWEVECIPNATRNAARLHQFSRPPLAGRRLRVGYISADFRQHAVSYFVEQLFAQHDVNRLEVFAYSLSTRPDAVTARLATLVSNWVPAASLTDQKLHERIQADQLDVLVDLGGHTADNRLGVLARRAAPVQAHWLGYFATTGLTEMDYWIGDPILTPPQTDHHFCETVWRLPRTWVSYAGKTDLPNSCWQPASDGTFWLGSFNGLVKLTTSTLALWAQVLMALPAARLLLKTKELAEERNRRRILDAFTILGIDPARIELQDGSNTTDWVTHMCYYDRLDIALDPIGGLGGGTTSCDALWMGVPMVTLMGDRMASRMTASMLDAMGKNEWIATTEIEYVQKVVALAYDVAGRQAMRLSQRVSMATSPLCDAAGLARSLEDAYEAMFDEWWQQTNSPHDLPTATLAT